VRCRGKDAGAGYLRSEAQSGGGDIRLRGVVRSTFDSLTCVQHPKRTFSKGTPVERRGPQSHRSKGFPMTAGLPSWMSSVHRGDRTRTEAELPHLTA